MKKMFSLLLLVLIITVVKTTNVYADAGTEFFLTTVYTSRYSYIEDQDGNPLGVKVDFEFYDTPLYDSYNIRFEQVDYNGNYVKLLSAKDYEPVVIGVTDDISFQDDFTKIRFGSNNIAFWRLVYNNVILHSGAVMKRPEFEAIDSNTIEIEDYVYNDGGLPDVTDHSQYTINKDDYFIVHYRFDEDWASDPSYDLDIVIHDLATGTFVDGFAPDDILGVQLFDQDIATGEDFRNSFILIPTNGVIPPFAVVDYDAANDAYTAITDLDLGTYQVSLRNAVGTWADSASTPLNVASENDTIFDLRMVSDEYTIGDYARITFDIDSISSYDAWFTTSAADDNMGSFDLSAIDDLVSTRTVEYLTDDGSSDGDIVNVNWDLQILSVAFGAGSVDTTYYEIQLSDSYVAVDGATDVLDSMTSFLAAYNLNNDVGYMLVVFISFLFINIIFAVFKAPLSVFVIIDTLLLTIFIFLGYVSAWFSVMVGFLLISGLLKVSRSDL